VHNRQAEKIHDNVWHVEALRLVMMANPKSQIANNKQIPMDQIPIIKHQSIQKTAGQSFLTL